MKIHILSIISCLLIALSLSVVIPTVSAYADNNESSDINSHTDTHTHSYTQTIAKTVSCTEDGIILFSCDCGDKYTEIIPSSGHNYTVSTIAPDYGNKGYDLHTCMYCNDSYKDNYTPALVLGNVTTANFLTTANTAKMTCNKVENATGYCYYQYNASKKTWAKVATTQSNSYTFTKLTSGTSYAFTAKAYITKNGKTTLSPKFTAFKTSTLPDKVNFKLTSGVKTVKATWSKVRGATGYIVYYKTSVNGNWVRLGATKGTSYAKTGLKPLSAYYFTVKAYRTFNGQTYNGAFVAKGIMTKPIKATGISLSKTKVTVERGKSFTLKAIVKPANTTDKTIWRSSNTTVATVSANGVVKAIKPGKAVILAAVNGKKASCTVTVTKIRTKAISLSRTNAETIIGESIALTRIKNPNNSDEGVTWSSNNTSIASITISGQTCIVWGNNAGTAYITATSGNVKATCKVVVYNPPIGKVNALKSAESYLSVMSFSYKGLIEQLEYEGYSYDEAKYGANNCGANWYDQAAKSAQSYISTMSFSRQSLKEQLIYEGFTNDQAEYGVASVGY